MSYRSSPTSSSSRSRKSNHHSLPVSDEKLSLEQKLYLVGRPAFLSYFEELRKCDFSTPNLSLVCDLLAKDCFSLRHRSLAVKLVAGVLRPGPFLQSPSEQGLEPREFTFLDEASQKVIAVVFLDEEDTTKEAAPTVTLTHGDDIRRFELYSTLGFYALFNAMLNPEIALKKQEVTQKSKRKHKTSTRGRSMQKKTFTTTKNAAVNMDPNQAQVQAWAAAKKDRDTTIKNHRIVLNNSGDTSTGRKRQKKEAAGGKGIPPSPLRTELVPFKHKLRFIDRSTGGKIAFPPNSSLPPENGVFVSMEEERSFYRTEAAVEQMLADASSFLEPRNRPLADCLRDLRCEMFGSHTTRAKAPAALPASPSKHAGLNKSPRDEVHLVSSVFPPTIEISLEDAGFHRKRWVVMIRHRVIFH